MNKAVSVALGLVVSAGVTMIVLFLLRQSSLTARISGLQPAKSINPFNEAA